VTPRRAEAGLTLMEMLVVIAIASLMVGISFPAITSGIDSLRINTACDSVVSFLNSGLTRAERRQLVVEISILRPERMIQMRSADASFVKELTLPEGVTFERILPETMGVDDNAPRRFLIYPGGVMPRFGVELVNRRGVHRIVRVDPISGVPLIERPEVQP
jgi:prepilin-type N-terminal cleavage/methylation domain-containing protein